MSVLIYPESIPFTFWYMRGVACLTAPVKVKRLAQYFTMIIFICIHSPPYNCSKSYQKNGVGTEITGTEITAIKESKLTMQFIWKQSNQRKK